MKRQPRPSVRDLMDGDRVRGGIAVTPADAWFHAYAEAWFDFGESGCARPCPGCPGVKAAIQVACGYYTSAPALARHLRQFHRNLRFAWEEA